MASRISCPNAACHASFRNFESFLKHYRKLHLKALPNATFTCPIPQCRGLDINGWDAFVSHMNIHIRKAQAATQFQTTRHAQLSKESRDPRLAKVGSRLRKKVANMSLSSTAATRIKLSYSLDAASDHPQENTAVKSELEINPQERAATSSSATATSSIDEVILSERESMKFMLEQDAISSASICSDLADGPASLASQSSQVDAPVDPTDQLSSLVNELRYDDASTDALNRRDPQIVSCLYSQDPSIFTGDGIGGSGFAAATASSFDFDDNHKLVQEQLFVRSNISDVNLVAKNQEIIKGGNDATSNQIGRYWIEAGEKGDDKDWLCFKINDRMLAIWREAGGEELRQYIEIQKSIMAFVAALDTINKGLSEAICSLSHGRLSRTAGLVHSGNVSLKAFNYYPNISPQEREHVSEQENLLRQLQEILSIQKLAMQGQYLDALRKVGTLSFLLFDPHAPDATKDMNQNLSPYVQALVSDLLKVSLECIDNVRDADGSLGALRSKIANCLANNLNRNWQHGLYERVA